MAWLMQLLAQDGQPVKTPPEQQLNARLAYTPIISGPSSISKVFIWVAVRAVQMAAVPLPIEIRLVYEQMPGVLGQPFFEPYALAMQGYLVLKTLPTFPRKVRESRKQPPWQSLTLCPGAQKLVHYKEAYSLSPQLYPLFKRRDQYMAVTAKDQQLPQLP